MRVDEWRRDVRVIGSFNGENVFIMIVKGGSMMMKKIYKRSENA